MSAILLTERPFKTRGKRPSPSSEIPMCLMFAMLALTALAAGASAACDACVAGRCHSRAPLLSGFPASNMVIDTTDNVLYLRNNDQNVAILLDNLHQRLINIVRTTAMAFHQISHALFLATEEGAVYKYNLATNETLLVIHIEYIRSNTIKYLDNNLVYVETYTNSTSGFNFKPIDTFGHHFSFSVNYLISDFIVDSRNIYFVSNDTLYVCDNQIYSGSSPPQPPRAILSKKQIVISSTTKDGEFDDWIYIGSPTEKLIYKLSKTSHELIIHAGYKAGSVQEFVLGRNGHVVFRDADGSIAQWKPSIQHSRCVVEPPQDNFFVRQTNCISD